MFFFFWLGSRGHSWLSKTLGRGVQQTLVVLVEIGDMAQETNQTCAESWLKASRYQVQSLVSRAFNFVETQ